MATTTDTTRTMLPVHQAGQCSVAAASEIVGSKWTVLIVHDLSEGPRRFTELEHACARISPRTLAERLRWLEAEEIVVRRSYAESPPRVEYELTEKGLPTPNLFTGGQNYHSVREWASVQDMAAAAATCVELVRLWGEPDRLRRSS